MTSNIRVFVGSDVWQFKAGAELALAESIFQHTSEKVDLYFMRAGAVDDELTSPGFAISPDGEGETWKVGRPIDEAWPKRGWGTPFACFRACIAELCAFEGKAIYLDVDMLVLSDIAELWRLPQKAPYLCNGKGRTEVALIDCQGFARDDWPRIKEMKPQGATMGYYRLLMERMGLLDESLPWAWNSCDQITPGMKLLHFTSVPHQPYKPYPKVEYRKHPDERAVRIWNDYFAAARLNPTLKQSGS